MKGDLFNPPEGLRDASEAFPTAPSPIVASIEELVASVGEQPRTGFLEGSEVMVFLKVLVGVAIAGLVLAAMFVAGVISVDYFGWIALPIWLVIIASVMLAASGSGTRT